IRLVVLHSESGLELFSHSWIQNDAIFNPTLFTGLIQAGMAILDKTVNKGTIEEIKLQQATLLVHKSTKSPFTIILITTKISKILRDAVKSFGDILRNEFSVNFENNVLKLENGENLDKRIEDSFPFVPFYS
ncbi:MAG TPA: hypothetical protein VKK79_05575, partial [Candidatus Lokiarchaeia archaeon]|nr:hypothetical protein [Candidatus Lokiarchaeia archaeon]